MDRFTQLRHRPHRLSRRRGGPPDPRSRGGTRRGEPLEPIIDGRTLTRISFGYDEGAVDAFLSELRGGAAPAPQDGDEDEDQSAILPVDGAQHLGTVAEPAFDPSQRILAELDTARFRMSRRQVPGYDVGIVDAFLDDLRRQVEVGRSVLPAIQESSFRMAPRGSDGYEVVDVEAFLDMLEDLAANPGSAGSVAVGDPATREAGWSAVSKPILWVVGVVVLVYIAFMVL